MDQDNTTNQAAYSSSGTSSVNQQNTANTVNQPMAPDNVSPQAPQAGHEAPTGMDKWIAQARQITSQTLDDPYKKSQLLAKLKADCNYGRDISE